MLGVIDGQFFFHELTIDCVCATEGTHKLDKTQVIMVSPCGGTAEEEKKLGAPVTEEVTDSDVSHVTLEAITKEVTVPDGATNATLTEVCMAYKNSGDGVDRRDCKKRGGGTGGHGRKGGGGNFSYGRNCNDD